MACVCSTATEAGSEETEREIEREEEVEEEERSKHIYVGVLRKTAIKLHTAGNIFPLF